ncbi:MAG: thymidylate synthase [Colwellia sp.]|nr:thymidylate synthase [Colwellia sp.]
MVSSYEKQYKEMCKNILDNGEFVGDRTKTGVYSIFGGMIRHDLSKGFPILTCKKINPVLPVGELLWMLSGQTDLPSLRKYQSKPEGSHTIWSDDFEKYRKARVAEDPVRYSKDELFEEGLGNIYGKQLRNFHLGVRYWDDHEEETHDQLTTLIDNIKAVVKDPEHPMGRRLRCSFWNPYDHTVGDKVTCALPACHTDFQCIVRNGKLHLQYSMRSNDIFLGNPFNEVFYATLCHCLAQLTGLEVGELVYTGVDIHIYSNHLEQVEEMLSREDVGEVPQIKMPKFETLEDLLELTGKDFVIENYKPHGFIKAPQAS